jgi:hypothetical protein
MYRRSLERETQTYSLILFHNNYSEFMRG